MHDMPIYDAEVGSDDDLGLGADEVDDWDGEDTGNDEDD